MSMSFLETVLARLEAWLIVGGSFLPVLRLPRGDSFPDDSDVTRWLGSCHVVGGCCCGSGVVGDTDSGANMGLFVSTVGVSSVAPSLSRIAVFVASGSAVPCVSLL